MNDKEYTVRELADTWGHNIDDIDVTSIIHEVEKNSYESLNDEELTDKVLDKLNNNPYREDDYL